MGTTDPVLADLARYDALVEAAELIEAERDRIHAEWLPKVMEHGFDCLSKEQLMDVRCGDEACVDLAEQIVDAVMAGDYALAGDLRIKLKYAIVDMIANNWEPK